MASATCSAEVFQGLPCHRLRLPNGDSLLVAEHGAQVLSWCSGGVERLYLSPRSLFDGVAAIRGGVPVCWPQFNQRGALPKHGFARNLPWTMGAVTCSADAASLTFHLQDNLATHQHWPQAFEAALTVNLQPSELRVTLSVRNTGAQDLRFTGALHTYLAVQDIAHTRLRGLQGQAEWNAVADTHGRALDALAFSNEFDRVYAAPSAAMALQDGSRALHIEHSPGWANVVVWNPGAEKCAALADMPPDGHRHMLCVEAAQVFEPIVLAPGAEWQGWQHLRQYTPC